MKTYVYMSTLKKPKCKFCWDKGYATQLRNIHTGADFNIKASDKMEEIKMYCRRCKKGKKMYEQSQKKQA